MAVGVENSNTEHQRIRGQRAKSDLGRAFQGLFHSKRRSQIIHNKRAKLVPKKTKKKS